jgi:hypothetical protein
MKLAATYLIMTGLVLSVGARSEGAASEDKPYSTIVERNMFGLVPIPPPDVGPPPTPVDPPPKITFNGIMTIFGRDQALFKVVNKPKAGQPAKEDAYVLAEGERQDDIEVVKINKATGMVTFNNHGEVQELSLAPADASAGAAPALAAGGGNNYFARAGAPPVPMSLAERAALRRAQAQGRNLPVSPSGNPAMAGGAVGGSPDANGAAPGGFNTPINSSQIYHPELEQNDSMTPEQNVLLIEAQRMKYLQDNDPRAPMMPPTPITGQVLNSSMDPQQ